MELSDNERQMVENWLADPNGYPAVNVPVLVRVTRRKWADPAPFTGDHFAYYVTEVGQVRGEIVARGEPRLVVTDSLVPSPAPR